MLKNTEELMAMVSQLRQKMIVVPTKHRVLDIVGTGGDGMHTINISTGSAILAASCGVKIAKHGSRAVTSLAGAADVLEVLGVNIQATPEKISDCIDQVGIGFCFAPNFHPALAELRALRQQLKVSTQLNILGPLLNPANASHFLLGVFQEDLLPMMADVLKQSGSRHSAVVHGCGLDEISCAGPAKMIEIKDNILTTTVIDPVALGFNVCRVEDLRGGDATVNAQLLRDIFAGKKGAMSDTLILNAAVALYLYDIYPSIADAIVHARENLYQGQAQKTLKQWVECSYD